MSCLQLQGVRELPLSTWMDDLSGIRVRTLSIQCSGELHEEMLRLLELPCGILVKGVVAYLKHRKESA